MQLPITLCFLVGLTLASNPGWHTNQEYLYKVNGRSLSSLNEIDNDYTGIFIRANLRIKPRTEELLDAVIENCEFAEWHNHLSHGWKSQVADSALEYKTLNLDDNRFTIVMKNGVIRDLQVSDSMKNWQANFVKAVVNQFQLDVQAQNRIHSHVNIFPKQGENSGVFKTMEEALTGISETTYDIHPLPGYAMQNAPWLVPMPELREESGDFIEIVKSKNYSNARELPSYHHGFTERHFADPASNHLGRFMSRTTITRAIITGYLENHVIQSSSTVDEISVAPTVTDGQRGSVKTIMNVTLVSIKQSSHNLQPINHPMNLGSIVYKYDDPSEKTSNSPRSGNSYDHTDSDSSYESMSSGSLDSYANYWTQDQPKLNEAPKSPLLLFTVGFGGKNIKSKNPEITKDIEKLARTIAQEITSRPDEMPEMNTHAKFVTLAALLRTMDDQDMKQIGDALYNENHDGEAAAAWKVFRDAVAEAGTGPALLNIKRWVEDGKLRTAEDAQIIQALAESTRVPTYQYMNAFFELVKSDAVQKQAHLNSTALLAFTKLVNNVYITKPISQTKYPQNSFGIFYSDAGKKWVRQEVIPWLSQQLEKSIKNADTQKIHVCIKALGNIGDRTILEVFKPYLVGDKQVSQFQRFLMVVSLEHFVSAYPEVARSVLYKIYQNPQEYDQVRVAAVYQLMRTAPPASMLQRLAAYTNEDPSEYVNAAVQSSIMSAAKLQGREYANLKEAAQSALHLLTEREYGAQFSKNYLHSYLLEEMKMDYKETFQFFGHEDHILPEGLHYNLRGRFAGLRQHIVQLQGFVSSVDDLINAFERTTEDYQKQKKMKDSSNIDEDSFSSERIAEVLGMKVDQREQLEGVFSLSAGQLQKIFSFDNRSIERLPAILQEFERYIRDGEKFSVQKMAIENEYAVAIPTAMSFPFIYIHDKPMTISIQGDVNANFVPQISNGQQLKDLESFRSDFNIRVLVSGKTQSQFGIITPFNYKNYYAGYDKHFQIHAPFSGSFDVNFRNQKATIEMGRHKNQEESETQLVHFSTRPYTCKNDIFQTENSESRDCRQPERRLNEFKTVLGDKVMGIPLHVDIVSDQHLSKAWTFNKLRKQNPVSALLSPWADENIQTMKMNIRINHNQTPTKVVVFNFAYSDVKNENSNDAKEFIDAADLDQVSHETAERLKRFSQLAAGQIKSSESRALHTTVEFKGQKSLKYSATVAMAKSNVDPRSCVLVHIGGKGEEMKPVLFTMTAYGKFENTNGLNFREAMKLNPTATIKVEATLGESLERAEKINANIKYSRSEERTRYLEQHPRSQECIKHMDDNGNFQLPECALMTARANNLNKFEYVIDYSENVQKIAYLTQQQALKKDDHSLRHLLANAAYRVFRFADHMSYPYFETDITEGGTGRNGMEIRGQFEPDFTYVNMTVVSKYTSTKMNNIPVNAWVKNVLVPHPVFHLKARSLGDLYAYPVFRPFCTIDKTAASTFDNKTYPLNLSRKWAVLLQYVTRRPSPDGTQVHDARHQLKNQLDSYVVLARRFDVDSEKKEIKIKLQSRFTKQRFVEIEMRPSTGADQLPELRVNGKQIAYNKDKAAQFENADYIQAYGLPTNELKVEVENTFYVIYDGTRAKITVVNHKLRGAVQGLCGTFTGEAQTDFLSPQGCILKDARQFVASYIVEGKERVHIPESQCYRKEVRPAKVISPQDIFGQDDSPSVEEAEHGSNHCTKHQTEYLEERDLDCFSVRPVVSCKSPCKPAGLVKKQIAFHCIERSRVSTLWKNQIKNGASPDFSNKVTTNSITKQVPSGCSA